MLSSSVKLIIAATALHMTLASSQEPLLGSTQFVTASRWLNAFRPRRTNIPIALNKCDIAQDGTSIDPAAHKHRQVCMLAALRALGPQASLSKHVVYVGSPASVDAEKSPAMLKVVTDTLEMLRERGCQIYIGTAQQGKGNKEFEALAARIGAQFVDMEKLSLSSDAGRYSLLLVPGGPGAQFEATNFRAAGADVLALLDSSAKLGNPEWYDFTVEQSRENQADFMTKTNKVSWESIHAAPRAWRSCPRRCCRRYSPYKQE